MIAFDHVGRINQLADFRRILEKCGNFAPAAPLGLHDKRVFDAPDFLIIVKRRQAASSPSAPYIQASDSPEAALCPCRKHSGWNCVFP